ncbi:hypothetical protein [Wolbachia endosymbiont (group A) of Acrocera orbiculus]|uniref:hypothetical protein n=1 Tax=Wolbachia endosymbiont (group A) of Acrocera orbiculus TaxID=2953971 RepID=UPI0022270DAC|nr:hypothetical protein [Wolbachia endosymbiont (group A) of Acrocera orbiculus]
MKKINGKKLPSKMLKAVERIAKEGLLPNFIKAAPTANKKISKLPVLTYPEELNPFRSALCRTRLSEYENMKLNEFLEKAIAAKNINELSKVIDEALDLGIRINAANEDGFGFANVTMFKMYRDEFKGNKQEDIIRKLALNGADFNVQVDKKITEIHQKVQKEIEPQIYSRLTKLREVGENATIEGTVENVEIDNKTFYMEFSHSCIVDVAKVVEGAKNLGLSKGDLNLGGNIIKIGDGEVEVKTGKGGERDYVDISDNSAFAVTFYTSLGELNLMVYHDTADYHQVQIEVEDEEMWNELQEIGEIVGKGCLFGGMSVKETVEKGSFTRCERWGDQNSKSSETFSWVNKLKDNKTTSVGRS